LIDAQVMLFTSNSELGRMVEARKAVEVVTRLANDLRQPAQLWLGVAPRALLALMEGDFALAEELVQRETDSRLQTTSARDDESAGRMHRFLLRREQGRLAEEETTVRASVDDFPWYPLHRAALACLLLDLDRDAEARAVFEDLAQDEFRAFYHDNEWLLGISLASEACALLGDGPAAQVLYDQLGPFAGRHAIGHAEGSVGAVDRYLGLLAETLGRLDDAVQHLTAAIEINEGWGARPWAAHCRHDLAQVLVRRDSQGDRDRAAQLDRAALSTATAIGMVLAQQIRTGAGEPVSAAASQLPLSSQDWAFRLEGEYWVIGGERLIRLRDGKGLQYLAKLLGYPGREFHALDLAAGSKAVTGSARTTAEAAAVGLRPEGSSGPDIGIDEAARAAYRARLRELEADVDEAESFNDSERAARAREEMEALEAELSAAYGLGGRARPAITAAERARQSVTKAIRDALARITQQDQVLGAHFARSVRTGLYCVYDPDPAAGVRWTL
jgi:tetratricopeptide (TPR) repeat protein